MLTGKLRLTIKAPYRSNNPAMNYDPTPVQWAIYQGTDVVLKPFDEYHDLQWWDDWYEAYVHL